MANIFLAYRFTGENPQELETILSSIRDSLQSGGHHIVCTFWLSDFFKKQEFTTDQIYEYGLQRVDECDVFLAFVKSADPSKGMNMESRRAIEKNKKYLLAIKKGLDFSEFRSAAHDIIEYSQLTEVYSNLRALKL